jgi:hypothetical protein
MRGAAALAAVTSFLLLPVLGAPSAQALSCVGPDEVLADAEQVFTGRIMDASEGRLLIAVEEVWKGAPVEGYVWMGVDQPSWSEWADSSGEVPDGYRSPDRWVFAPSEAEVGPCTAWQVTPSFLADHAPVDPQLPVEDGALGHAGESRPGSREGATPGELATYAAVGLGAGVLATLATLVALRRRSPRRRSRKPPG